MEKEEKSILSHVLWIGGPANAGKTTISRIIGKRNGFQRYSYDKSGEKHLHRLAQSKRCYQEYLENPLDMRWAGLGVTQVVERSLQSYLDRFPLVIEDIKELSNEVPIIAEGIDFTPEIIHPIMSSPYQAIWLIPTRDFMERLFQKKAKFLQSQLGIAGQTTISILFEAGLQMIDILKVQVEEYKFRMYEIDGLKSKAEIETAVMTHLNRHITKIAKNSA